MPIRQLLALIFATLSLAACGWGGPLQPLFTAEGKVTDANGQPLAGAVISDGQVGVLSDDDGHYRIGLFDTHLRIKKPGYAPTTLEATRDLEAQVKLQASGERPRVAIDARWVGDRMDKFGTALAKAGFSVKAYPATPLSQIDVLMLVTPGPLQMDEVTSLRGWLKAGGRLVLCGEWGGYPAQDLDLLNSLSQDAGITFTGATVKLTEADPDGAEWMSIQGISPPSLGKLAGAEALHLYTATSLRLTPSAQPIFATDKRAYGVLATRTGPQILGAVGASGLGKIFAVGDSSLWLDEDSGGFGSPNWQRGGNLKLAKAMLQW
jgi:predicted small lipoprotein YifL